MSNVFTVTVSCAVVLAACSTVDGPSAEEPLDSKPRAGALEESGSGSDSDSETDVDTDSESDAPPFSNPWIEASKVAGGVPLFEQLNDEQGRRYVVGEGMHVDENGEVHHFWLS